ncbi:unnamed protein product, partial [Symbiodinium sp. CCMP2456]
ERALKIGVSTSVLRELTDAGYTTFGKLCFAVSANPTQMDDGAVDTWIRSVLSEAPTPYQTSCLRRLLFEANSLNIADLHARVEPPSDNVVRRLPAAERAARSQAQQARLTGVVFAPDTTPANGLVDLFVGQLETEILQYVGPERCVSRAQEMMSVKVDKTINIDQEGRMRVASKPAELRCETSSDAKLRSAWNRRSLAMDLAGLCSYIQVEKWVQHLFSLQAREVPKGMSPISINQLIQSDRALFMYASEKLMGKLAVPAGAPKPLDAVIQDLMHSPEVMQFMQPVPRPPEPVVPWTPRGEPWTPKGKGKKGKDGKGKNGKGDGQPSKPDIPEGCVVEGPSPSTNAPIVVECRGVRRLQVPMSWLKISCHKAEGKVINFPSHLCVELTFSLGFRACVEPPVEAPVHQDSHNLAGSLNAVFALSSFSGGGIVVEDPEGPQRASFRGKIVHGRVVPFVENVILFDAQSQKHWTQPWTGSRQVMVAYSVPMKGLSKEVLSFDWKVRNVQVPIVPLDLSQATGIRLPGISETSHEGLRLQQANKLYEFTLDASRSYNKLQVSMNPCSCRATIHMPTIVMVGSLSVVPADCITKAMKVLQEVSFKGENAGDSENDVEGFTNEVTVEAIDFLMTSRPEQEAELHARMSPSVAKVMKDKKIVALKTLLSQEGYDDLEAVNFLSEGVKVLGSESHPECFEKKVKPASLTEQDLRDTAQARREAIVGSKQRPIDDACQSQTNAAYSATIRLELHNADYIASVALFIAKRVKEGRQRFGSGDWVGKCLDLTKAYKQMALHPSHRDLCVTYFRGPDGKEKFFLPNSLMFGATAAVYGFIRVSRCLWFLINRCLKVPSAVYFDDYPIFTPCEGSKDADDMVSQFLSMLGWDHAKTGQKGKPCASSFDVLGMTLDLSQVRQGLVTLRNKPGRAEKILEAFEEVDAPEAITRHQIQVLHGLLNFAAGFLAGRSLKHVCYDLLELLEWRGTLAFAKLKELARRTREILEGSPPRLLSCLFAPDPILIWTDGSWESGVAGIGACVWDPLSSAGRVFAG